MSRLFRAMARYEQDRHMWRGLYATEPPYQLWTSSCLAATEDFALRRATEDAQLAVTSRG